MANWKPVYLVHGDAHGRIVERRGRLRALAEAESGAEGVEVLEGDAATPEAAGAALRALTFAIGRRFVIVDGVERWKDEDVQAHLAPALEAPSPDTTVAFFAREDGRARTPAKLVALVQRVGEISAETTPRAKDLPRWVTGEAQRLGVTIELRAAQALVALVGDRQPRLLREIEKLAIEHGPGATLGVEAFDAAAHSAERQVWGLVDALVGGDEVAATRSFLELRAQGEAIARLVPLMARRVRDVLAIVARLDGGEAPAQIKASMRGSPWMADRRIKEARATDADALRRAVEALAELEVSTRGGSELDDDTAALRAIAVIAA